MINAKRLPRAQMDVALAIVSKKKQVRRFDAPIKAFTLSEVLITLVVIGVVAAITVPVMANNIQQKVREERISNIMHKFSKGTDAMLAATGMNGYSSTMEFVEEFQKHFKLAKVCDNNHIADCWPTETVMTGDEEWDIASTQTPATLRLTNSDTEEWDNTVGIITADGTSMILSYNKKCDMAYNNGIVWPTKSMSNSTACVAAVFDWNGGKKPNAIGENVKNQDIITTINAGGLGRTCTIELNGKCFVSKTIDRGLTESECLAANIPGVGTNCCSNSDCPLSKGGDSWAAAMQKCNGKLPTKEDMFAIRDKLYEGCKVTASYNGEYIEYDCSSGGKNETLATSLLGSSNGSVEFWLIDTMGSTSSFFVSYDSSSADWGVAGREKSNIRTLCVAE